MRVPKCMPVYQVYAWCSTEQSTESLEQELWVVVSHYVAPGIKPRFSEDQSVLVTTEASFQKPIL